MCTCLFIFSFVLQSWLSCKFDKEIYCSLFPSKGQVMAWEYWRIVCGNRMIDISSWQRPIELLILVMHVGSFQVPISSALPAERV